MTLIAETLMKGEQPGASCQRLTLKTSKPVLSAVSRQRGLPLKISIHSERTLQEDSMTTVTSKDGTRIAFDKIGSGPALIIVNGAIQFRAFDPTMAQIADMLSKHFTVYNYDRRGRGESGDTQPFAKEREIEDLQALVEHAGGKA